MERSASLLAAFNVGQDAIDLPAELTVRQPASVNLGARFSSHAIRDLLGKFAIRRSSSVDLAAGFDAHASINLHGIFSIRHEATLDLSAGFLLRQLIDDMHARFRVENVFDLRGTAGIAFHWWGANNPPESIVDFIVESPTGFWVGEFYDGPAYFRHVFIPWTQFRETGLDGSRPDKSQVDGLIYIVHTSGLRRIDYIYAPLFGDLHALFNIRHTAIPRNLKGVSTVRQEDNVEILGKFSVN